MPSERVPRQQTKLWPIQGAIALIVLGAVALMPPARGPMLLLPLGQQAADHLAARAIGAGASLVAPGPLPGSLIVDGTRARLAAVVSRGVLIVNAPSGWCGLRLRPGKLA